MSEKTKKKVVNEEKRSKTRYSTSEYSISEIIVMEREKEETFLEPSRETELKCINKRGWATNQNTASRETSQWAVQRREQEKPIRRHYWQWHEGPIFITWKHKSIITVEAYCIKKTESRNYDFQISYLWLTNYKIHNYEILVIFKRYKSHTYKIYSSIYFSLLSRVFVLQSSKTMAELGRHV